VRRISNLFLSFLLLTASAAAAGRYHYWMQTQQPLPNSSLSGLEIPIGPWTVMWDSDTILVPPACPGIDVTKLSGYGPTPLTSQGFSLSSLFLCADSGVGSGLGYNFPYEFDGIWVEKGVVSSSLSQTEFQLNYTCPVFGCNAPEPLSPSSFSGITLYWPSPTADFYDGLATVQLVITDTWGPLALPIPVWRGSFIRLTIAGPVTPPPGSPVEALIGLTDLAGNPIGQPQRVSINPGQVASVDFNSGLILQGLTSHANHANVVPVLSVADPLAPPLRITTEVFDWLSGFGGVLTTTDQTAPPPSQLAPQGLADGQVMRLIATAGSPNPCIATLSFADKNGAPIGTSAQVNLTPGQSSQPLDLSATTLGLRFGQRAEVQPMVQLPAAAPGAPFPPLGTGAAPAVSICSVSSEVFGANGGRTWTYQTAFVQ